MAQIFGGQTFDATQVSPQGDLDVLPAGEYPVEIVASEMKTTKNGDGQYLELEYSILDGEYSGRKLWDRLNLENPNAQAVEIAQRALSAICHATGQMQVQNSEQLHHKAMIVKVHVKGERTDQKTGKQYGPSNTIKAYKPLAGAAPSQAPAATRVPSVVNAAKPAASVPPWKRNAA